MSDMNTILDRSADHIRAALLELDNVLPLMSDDMDIEIGRLAFNIQLILSDIHSLKGKYDEKL